MLLFCFTTLTLGGWRNRDIEGCLNERRTCDSTWLSRLCAMEDFTLLQTAGFTLQGCGCRTLTGMVGLPEDL